MTDKLFFKNISETHFSDMKLSILDSLNIYIKDILLIMKDVASTCLISEDAQNITVKGDSNFVTAVDMNIEAAMKERLSTKYPQIQFMGEERDNSEVDFSGAVWILDPVDGTSNLIHDFRNSSMSLALSINKEVVLGIIYHYFSDEMTYAIKGKGAYLNGRKIQVSNITELSRSLVSFGTSPYDKATLGEKNMSNLKDIFFLCEDIRRIGSAAIELAYVAAGRVDIYFERNLKPWDFSAGIIIIQEAGGTITNFRGEPIDISKPSDILAGNGTVNELLRNKLGLI